MADSLTDPRPLNREQFQMFLEFIAAQGICMILDHEVRVHNPFDLEAKAMLQKANDGRQMMIDNLRAKLVRS